MTRHPRRNAKYPWIARRAGASRVDARSGLTLIEVLVAIVLLVIGIGGVMELFTNQMVGQKRSLRRLQAETLARGYLAQIQAAGYSELKSRYLADATEAYFGGEQNHFKEPDGEFWGGARLHAEQPVGLRPVIRIAVQMNWGPGASGTQNAAEADQTTSGEVVGYVVAP